jgi:hypothetical protein
MFPCCELFLFLLKIFGLPLPQTKEVSQTTSASLLRKCLPVLIPRDNYVPTEVPELWIHHLFFNFLLVVPFFRDAATQSAACQQRKFGDNTVASTLRGVCEPRTNTTRPISHFATSTLLCTFLSVILLTMTPA